MKEFLLQNWYYVLVAVLAIASFIASLVITIKKKGSSSNLFDSVKAAILENLPMWAILSEGLVSGADKKNNVLQLGIALASKLLGRNLTADENAYFVSFIGEQLEKILSAPQKKLIKVEEPAPSKYRIGG